LAALGIKLAASTVWEILKAHGIDPSPERTATTWTAFLRSQAGALLACDFFEVRTLTGARLSILAVIEHATRRIRILGVRAHPTGQWVTQLGRNLAMDLQDVGTTATFLIRDRDAQFTPAFDKVLADAGVRIVKKRCPDTADELHHGALDPDLPTRAAGPHLDLEPAPSPTSPS
jgi:hypothetical protein